ncbi:hypothetical protein COL71_28830 [Bacillus mycoides]|nr:hypothetical protein BW891_19220 [Bacillus mycoides]PGA03877.1 hypothetical protein COL71_28830 [Bacillus mycoides]TXR79537.1 hypothetical protein DN408_16295 [Bacillus sp. AR13-1]
MFVTYYIHKIKNRFVKDFCNICEREMKELLDMMRSILLEDMLSIIFITSRCSKTYRKYGGKQK